MDIDDEQVIAAPRERVWSLLNDLEVLKACIPGCETLDATGENALTAAVVTKIGPIKARFAGDVTLADLEPPARFTMTGEGKGGVAGFAKGGAVIVLEPHPEGTLMRYKVQVQVGGKLAQLGNRLIDSTARKLSAQFFERFALKADEAQQAATPAEA